MPDLPPKNGYVYRITRKEDIEHLPPTLKYEHLNYCIQDVFDLLERDESITLLEASKSFLTLLRKKGYYDDGLNEKLLLKLFRWVKENFNQYEGLVNNCEKNDHKDYHNKDEMTSILAHLPCDESFNFLYSLFDYYEESEDLKNLTFILHHVRLEKQIRKGKIPHLKREGILWAANVFLTGRERERGTKIDPKRMREYDLYYEVGTISNRGFGFYHDPSLNGRYGLVLISKSTPHMAISGGAYSIHAIGLMDFFELEILGKEGYWELTITPKDKDMTGLSEVLDQTPSTIQKLINPDGKIILESVYPDESVFEKKAQLNKAGIPSKLEFKTRKK